MGVCDSLPSSGLAGLLRSMLAGVSTACFWLAVMFPFAYVPFLAGLPAGGARTLLGVLIAHAAMLYLGHYGHDVRRIETQTSR